ncbi:MAG TPA: hypothetical protein VFH70_01675 [Acidimicrobiales bacterium]|nr:hypothetical protein [Acidimicrobiales bacterium]
MSATDTDTFALQLELTRPIDSDADELVAFCRQAVELELARLGAHVVGVVADWQPWPDEPREGRLSVMGWIVHSGSSWALANHCLAEALAAADRLDADVIGAMLDEGGPSDN